MLNGPVEANTAMELHHIVKISESPGLRMNRNNWLAVCNQCHNEIENDCLAGMAVRNWSDQHYDKVLGKACREESQHLHPLK
jgi:5-methylcytosine-specific restriction endonuclease McrA